MAGINYLAVLLATIAAYLVGWAWYGGIFKNAWMGAHGLTPERMAAMKEARSPAVAMGVGFATQLATAFGLALLLVWTGYQTWQHGLAVAVFVWFFFSGTVGLMTTMYQGKTLVAFVIDAGYQLVYFALMGSIIGAWR